MLLFNVLTRPLINHNIFLRNTCFSLLNSSSMPDGRLPSINHLPSTTTTILVSCRDAERVVLCLLLSVIYSSSCVAMPYLYHIGSYIMLVTCWQRTSVRVWTPSVTMWCACTLYVASTVVELIISGFAPVVSSRRQVVT